MKARKRIEAVITGTIGNRVVFTGSGVRIPSLPPIKKDTLRVFFLLAEDRRISTRQPVAVVRI